MMIENEYINNKFEASKNAFEENSEYINNVFKENNEYINNAFEESENTFEEILRNNTGGIFYNGKKFTNNDQKNIEYLLESQMYKKVFQGQKPSGIIGNNKIIIMNDNRYICISIKEKNNTTYIKSIEFVNNEKTVGIIQEKKGELFNIIGARSNCTELNINVQKWNCEKGILRLEQTFNPWDGQIYFQFIILDLRKLDILIYYVKSFKIDIFNKSIEMVNENNINAYKIYITNEMCNCNGCCKCIRFLTYFTQCGCLTNKKYNNGMRVNFNKENISITNEDEESKDFKSILYELCTIEKDVRKAVDFKDGRMDMRCLLLNLTMIIPVSIFGIVVIAITNSQN